MAEAGRGRKQCPKCKDYVGVRCQKCTACGNPFDVRVSTPVQQEKVQQYNREYTTIITPSGPCPVEFSGDMRDWVQRVIDAGHSIRKHYQPAALRYWLRQFFDIHSAEHKQKIGELKLVYNEPTAPPIIPTEKDVVAKKMETILSDFDKQQEVNFNFD